MFIVAVFLFILDRYIKLQAMALAAPVELISDILRFNFAKNYNIAFSLPLGGPILIAFICLIIGGIIIYTLKLAKNNEWINVGLLTNILFGAISNLLDRFKYGYVVDYIDLKYFTVFNLADTMIVVGVFLIIIITFINEKFRNANN